MMLTKQSLLCAVIATDWSGPTAFLSEAVGYPLSILGLEQVEEKGAFEGHSWAQPSVQHLKQLMRRVVQDRKEAQAKGRSAACISPQLINQSIF